MANTQLDYLFKFGSYAFKGMIKAETYEVIPNARQDLDSYRDADGVLHRNALSHTATQVNFTIRAHTLAEHKAMMSAITSNYTNDNERSAECSYYDTEYCKYKTGKFYLDSNFGTSIYSIAEGLPMFAEKQISFVEY